MAPGLSCEKHRRGKPAEGRVRADLVVFRLPVVDPVLSMPHACEAGPVQQFVTDSGVEALGKRIRHGLTGADLVVLDATFVAPLVKGLLVNLWPFFVRIRRGSPCSSTARSRMRSTRCAGREMSHSSAVHSFE